MALNFFKQRDIDEMDPYDIPEEFINYFDTLSEGRKAEIIASRPDLADGLGYIMPKNEEKYSNIIEESEDNPEEIEEDESSEEKSFVEEETIISESIDGFEDISEEEFNIFSQIRKNRYADGDLDDYFVDGMNHLEALIVPDKTDICFIHRSKFEEKQIKYRPTVIKLGRKSGSTFGMLLRFCRKCRRVFIEESKAEYIHKELKERGIIHTFYDVHLTNLFLRSEQSSYQLSVNEKVYVPDTWVEENPCCPIHEEKLFDIPCEKIYMERKISFVGYFCEKCNKILVRNAVAVDLVDDCAMAGVPEIETERIAKIKPQKKPLPPKEIRPDYYIEEGKKTKYSYAHNADCYKLTEEDTVVISDSIYCNLVGHNTEEALALIMVREKQGGKKAYLFMVGYCDQCQKYYMDEDDYKAIYNVGRPEVTLLFDSDADSYQITSGEVFNLERKHLGKMEDDIQGEINEITNQPDYVNQYEVGSYDDGNLSFAKKVSKTKYGPRLEQLHEYIPKPYNYRVDITADGKTEIFYIGAMDIDLDGERRVISFNSELGHKLVNYQTIKVTRNGKEYSIKLSRQFDIEKANLYGYMNLRTDEDIIFRSGVTDPFLVRVLNMRKKQHNLIDIIATIQENQNRIVDEDMNKNMIIQGCAGSGKTMVLLHRLSSLQYKYNYFDFGENAMILTPNDEFSLHIKGLAEGLQIGNIERLSVEQYYINMLLRYSPEFKLENKLSSEMFVPQVYVDYIYSDQFTEDFSKAYDKVISQRNMLGEIIDNLTEAMGQPNRNINYGMNAQVVEQMRMTVNSMDSLVKQRESQVSIAQEEYDRIHKRNQFLETQIPKSEEFAANVVKETVQRIWIKVSSRLDELQQMIDIQGKELQELLEERQRVQETIIMFGKKARIAELDNKISVASRKLSDRNKQMEEEKEIYSQPLEDKSDDEIIAWMRQVMLYIKSVQEEIRLCQNTKQDFNSYKAEMLSIPEKLLDAKKKLLEAKESLYPEEVSRAIKYLNEKLEEYSLINTYQIIFDEAVYRFKEEHNIKKINGKYHRYGLYARLLFAMKYFGSELGTTRFMCVDEGQDIAFNEYMLIYNLNQRNIIFNIYGDTNQLIKPGRGINNWEKLQLTFGARQHILNENYRNTNQITRFCNSSFEMSVLQTGVDGAKVREISRRELESELASLNLSTERVAILVPRGVQKKKYLDLTMIPSDIQKRIGDKMENGFIAFKYVDEVKGIEFDKVYVVGNKMSRNEKYIAYTRALSELILVVDENIDDYDDGKDATEEEEGNANKKISTLNKNDEEKQTLVVEAQNEDISTNRQEDLFKFQSVVNLSDIEIEHTVSSDNEEKTLKAIAGSALKDGKYVEDNLSDFQMMDAMTYVFSAAARKDTSYKFAFYKSIIESLDQVGEDFRVSFDILFEKFTEIYWPLVVKYNIHQKVGSEKMSFIEQYLVDVMNEYGYDENTEFAEITKKQKEQIVKTVKQKCKTNVVGALYGDSKGVFYSFSKKEEWIEINPIIYGFLIENRKKLLDMVNEAWADFMEKVNTKDQKNRLLNIIDHSSDLSSGVYHYILKSAAINMIPVLSLIGPIISTLLRAS